MEEQPINSEPQPNNKRRKLLIGLAIVAAIVVAGGAAGALYLSQRPTDKDTGSTQPVIQSHRTYSLNLMEMGAYAANKPTELMFDIRDENNNVLKRFDTVHTKIMHLIVVRKDRSYFQHVHPNYDAASGMFAITGFTFPTNGEYRVFADFTASDAQMGPDNMKLASTPYKDVKVGDGNYTSIALGADKKKSDANGFSTEISLVSGDSPNLTQTITAGMPQMLGVNITKNGAPYKNLQTYLGALGHMVVLGPNLEFIHAHPVFDTNVPQTGMISFMVTFPDAGQYKLYLQTQADGQVNTTDYNLTVQPGADSDKKTDAPAEDNSSSDMNMEGMHH